MAGAEMLGGVADPVELRPRRSGVVTRRPSGTSAQEFDDFKPF